MNKRINKLFLVWFALAGGVAHAEERPNVVLICTDDHGCTDLGVLGIDKHVDTPNMDKLARGGALMTAGYSSAPQRQPSRAGLMAGRIQNELGFPHNACDAGEGTGRMPRTYPRGTDMAGQPVLTIADPEPLSKSVGSKKLMGFKKLILWFSK